MQRESFRDTLVASAAELGFGPELFRPLDDREGTAIAAAVEEAFGNAVNGAMMWWHSDRPCPVPCTLRHFPNTGWRHLVTVAPGPAALVWFLAEDWGRPGFVAFASTAEVVQAVLGNTCGFEYLVVGQRYDWLFAEDHEDCVSVAGMEAVRRLQALFT